MLFYACTNPEVTAEDREIMNRHGIKNSLITPDVPSWLEKWASLVLRFCEYEKNNIVKHLKEINPTYTNLQCELESKNILSNRISNIAITLDKVKHCLAQMKTDKPPLRKLTYREIFLKFDDNKNSFRLHLYGILEKLEKSELKEECIKTFWKAADVNIKDCQTDEECKEKFMKVLENWKELSLLIRKIKSNEVHTEAISDILYLYAHTHTYFTPTEAYFKVNGEEIAIRKCEVT